MFMVFETEACHLRTRIRSKVWSLIHLMLDHLTCTTNGIMELIRCNTFFQKQWKKGSERLGQTSWICNLLNSDSTYLSQSQINFHSRLMSRAQPWSLGTCEARTRKQYASLEHKKQHEMRMMRLTIIYCINAMKYLDIMSLMFMVIFTGIDLSTPQGRGGR